MDSMSTYLRKSGEVDWILGGILQFLVSQITWTRAFVEMIEFGSSRLNVQFVGLE